MTTDEYLDWVDGLLKVLRTVDGIFSKLYVVGRGKQDSTIIEQNGSNLKDVVLANLSRDIAYINANSQSKDLSLTSNCALGFSNTFVTTLESKVAGCLVETRVGKFANNSVNTVILQISEVLGTSEFLKSLFTSLILYCHPAHANCGRIVVDNLLAQPVGDIYISWLTYLTNTAAIELLPQGTEWNRFHEGIIVQTSDQPAFAGEEEKIEKMLSVISALQPHGILKNPRR